MTRNLGKVELETAHLKLRAVNGAEIPYSGILVVDVTLRGHRIPDVPDLVVKKPVEPSMRQRKQQVPMLLGMNVLEACPHSSLPEGLPVFLRECRHAATVHGLARAAKKSIIPALSIVTVKTTSNSRRSNSSLAAQPMEQSLSKGLMLVPTLVSADPSQRYVRIANLTESDVVLQSRTPLAILMAVDVMQGQDDVVLTSVSCNEVVVSIDHLEPPPTAPAEKVELPDFDGTRTQRQKLEQLLTKRAAAFCKDANDLGYTADVQHQLKSSTTSQWHSLIVAFRHTNCRKSSVTSKSCWTRKSSKRATSLTLRLSSSYERKTTASDSASTTGD